MARKKPSGKSRRRQAQAVEFRSATSLAALTIVLFACAAAFDVCLLAARVPTSFVAVAVFLQQAVVAPVFLAWFMKIYRNLPACDVAPRHGRFWVIWGFVIPFVNLVRPYRMLSEVWRSALDDPEDTPKSPVGIWWASWLAATMAPGCGLTKGHDSAGPNFVLLMFALAALLAMRMVRGVTARQERAVPIERSGVVAEIERADPSRARLRFVGEQPSGDAYREPAEDWLRIEGAHGPNRLLALGPGAWRTASVELPLRQVERLVVRRSVGWLPAQAHYSVRAAEPDGTEHTLLANLSASDARAAVATLEQRLRDVVVA